MTWFMKNITFDSEGCLKISEAFLIPLNICKSACQTTRKLVQLMCPRFMQKAIASHKTPANYLTCDKNQLKSTEWIRDAHLTQPLCSGGNHKCSPGGKLRSDDDLFHLPACNVPHVRLWQMLSFIHRPRNKMDWFTPSFKNLFLSLFFFFFNYFPALTSMTGRAFAAADLPSGKWTFAAQTHAGQRHACPPQSARHISWLHMAQLSLNPTQCCLNSQSPRSRVANNTRSHPRLNDSYLSLENQGEQLLQEGAATFASELVETQWLKDKERIGQTCRYIKLLTPIQKKASQLP